MSKKEANKKRGQDTAAEERRKVDVFYTDYKKGLSDEQVAERTACGYANTPVNPPTKSIKQIIFSNVVTYFNIIFFIFAIALILVGSWEDLSFLVVVFFNTLIGIIQELKAKKTLDGLNILSAPKATVIRGGKEQVISASDTVRDDIVIFKNGDQIYADAVVVAGKCQVNEALITGEADEIKKEFGSDLLSGSFVINGSCYARLTAVGKDAFISRLTSEAKRIKMPQKSEMMKSLSRLVKWIGIIVIPFGVVLTIKEIGWLGRNVASGVSSTIAALIGMIPEGLYLLTSMALAAGVVRLAQKKTVVHDLACIETLARVDTLCVDKTGTITENKMIVEDVVLLCEDRFVESDIRLIMADYVYAMKDDNETMAALRRYFTGEVKQTALESLPFSSAKKYGGVSFHEEETYLLGAPEIIMSDCYSEYKAEVEKYAAKGCRVLMLVLYDGRLTDEELLAEKMPLALILLGNKVRDEAPATFQYFAEQGVAVKVISGDNPMTVAEVAARAGIPDAYKYVDAQTLQTKSDIQKAANEYTVFGRVTPKQKRQLILAMKRAGHTVAMTGDGVNDVLALKAADCSVAMASGSEVACQVSQIVLMNSNFSSMPNVVQEGRRVINNIERSAALYLVKNIFSFVLAFITLFATLPYPFTPAQLSLVSGLTIGIPSFVLAMEPNNNRVKGKFLKNVIYRALPAAIADIILIVGVLLFYVAFKLNEGALSSICTAIMGVVGLLMVHKTSKPYNKLRVAMMVVCSVGFALSYFFLKDIFTLSSLLWSDTLILVVFAVMSIPVMKAATVCVEKTGEFIASHRRPKRRKRR